VPGVEQAESRLGVLGRDRERLRGRADRVVEGEAGVPDRVPELLGDAGDVTGGGVVVTGAARVQQQEVEVGERGNLAPAQPADRDQGDLGTGACLGQQFGQPRVECRRLPRGP
jgi:hypothetical protein